MLKNDLTPAPSTPPASSSSAAPASPWATGTIPQQTAARFITHPATGERLYDTGDLGRYRPDGSIEFLGREDHQVKLRGFRIELGEIEAALTRHPELHAAVAVLTGKADHRRLVAYVVPKRNAAAQVSGKHDLITDQPMARAAFILEQHGLPEIAAGTQTSSAPGR